MCDIDIVILMCDIDVVMLMCNMIFVISNLLSTKSLCFGCVHVA